MTERFQTVRGMRDFLPEQMRKKQWIEDVCRGVFEKYGFEPLQTPVVEDFGLLAKKGSGGEAIKEEIYFFKDKSDRELGLRFDLTVPLGRIMASNPTLPKPFKRYQIGTVYRYDRPQAKRYREFTQADVDILGVKGILAEYECLAIACEVMQQLGLNFYITLSSRGLLEEIAKSCSVTPQQMPDCFRAIDKLDKIGKAGVEAELKEKGINPKILLLLQEKNLDIISKMAQNKSAVNDIKQLFDLLKETDLEKFVRFDLSLARGLEYYTGTVFEVKVEQGPSVGGGGRYDKLVELYGGQPTPAIGISFGIDRLLDSIEEQGKTVLPKAQVLVTAFSEQQTKTALQTAQLLRKIGVNVEFDLLQRSASKNAEYCQKKGIRFLVLIGENEVKKGVVLVKDFSSNQSVAVKNELKSFKEFFGGS